MNDDELLEQFRRLYPHLSVSELHEAKRNLDRYVEPVLQIYERIRRDPEAYARFKAEINRKE